MKTPHTNPDEDVKRFYQSAHLASMRWKSFQLPKFYLFIAKSHRSRRNSLNQCEDTKKKNTLKFGKCLSSCCWCATRKSVSCVQFVRSQGAEQFKCIDNSTWTPSSFPLTRADHVFAFNSDQAIRSRSRLPESQRIDAMFYSKMSF